jgi:hypothetical protein
LVGIDVDFGESDLVLLGVLSGERFVKRSNGLAGTAPVGIDCEGSQLRVCQREELGERTYSRR